MTTLEQLQHASSVVKSIVERAAEFNPESPRTEADDLDLRAQIAMAVAHLEVASKLYDWEVSLNDRRG
jgi:hypothetical protein